MKRSYIPPLLGLLTLLSPLAGMAQEAPLADQLRRLAQQHQFVLKGAEHTDDAPESDASGPLPERLKRMLHGFNFILINPPNGKVERLIILGRKGDPPPPPVSQTEFEDQGSDGIVLETGGDQRRSTVQATLVGHNGDLIEVELLVDTGATSVVLPSSMIARLGMEEELLQPRDIRTANGVVQGRVGRLRAMRLADEEIGNIEVAFIDDAAIGNMALLGMNVLGRYKIVLDEDAKTLTLLPRKSREGDKQP